VRGAFVAAALAAVGIVGVVAVWGVGTAGAQSAPPTVDTVEMWLKAMDTQLDRLAAVQKADRSTNLVWAVGGLAGLGVGVAVGSVATYIGWRR
jgi:hypothetical protein